MTSFSQFSRFVSNLTKKSACLLLLAGTFLSSAAQATDPVIKGRTTVKISEVGESDVNVSLKTQTTYYSALKQLGSNFNLLARQIGMDDRNWTRQSPLDGSFIDSNNEVELKFNTPGAARNVKGNTWVVAVGRGETCQLVSATASRVTLMTAELTAIGLGTMVMEIELPSGATNAAFDSQKQEITYEFEPQVTNGTKPELQIEVDHKSTLMSSLAKNYSNPDFTYMWAARAVAKNTGDQVLSNYRIRFRVAEMGSWGSWQRVAKLYPGQTVVDPFFPIFDLEKMMALNGSRPAVIEVEYEYEEADGTKVEESDSFPVQILSRNEVIFSSMKPEQITGFADQFDYAPALFTSMTTPADPVVQQLAGRINGMAAESYGQSIAASSSDDECVAFMGALHHFLQTNHVAYQSPLGMLTQGNQGQHIKYTRDVMRNRAGTCVDLAVTWASVCEAVGLEPAIVLIPGHAFPAVKLPESQQWLAIESTMLNATFKDAVTRGNAELAEARKGNHYLVDITEVRKLGILGLDLPNVSEEYLTNLGYSFVAQRFEKAASEDDAGNDADPGTNNQEQQETTNTTSAVESPVVTFEEMTGRWGGYNMVNERKTWVGFSFGSDSGFEARVETYFDDGSVNTQLFHGTWSLNEGTLVLNGEGGNQAEFSVECPGNELKLAEAGDSGYLLLKRVN